MCCVGLNRSERAIECVDWFGNWRGAGGGGFYAGGEKRSNAPRRASGRTSGHTLATHARLQRNCRAGVCACTPSNDARGHFETSGLLLLSDLSFNHTCVITISRERWSLAPRRHVAAAICALCQRAPSRPPPLPLSPHPAPLPDPASAIKNHPIPSLHLAIFGVAVGAPRGIESHRDMRRRAPPQSAALSNAAAHRLESAKRRDSPQPPPLLPHFDKPYRFVRVRACEAAYAASTSHRFDPSDLFRVLRAGRAAAQNTTAALRALSLLSLAPPSCPPSSFACCFYMLAMF